MEKRKTKKVTTVENETRFTLRVPNNLLEKLEAEAKTTGRSINSQLIQILKERYEPKP